MDERVVSRAAKYGRVPMALIFDTSVSSAECHLYAYLTTFDFKMRGTCWPGCEQAAVHLGWSRAKVERTLRCLADRGAISRRQAGNGKPAQIDLVADIVREPSGVANGSIAAPSNLRLLDPAPSFPSDSPLISGKRTSIERELNEGHHRLTAAPASASDPRVASLVAGYVEDFQAERDGHQPSRRFKAACGQAAKAALKDGETVEDVARCLGVIAHESKNPTTLPYVLADMHANRPRRQR